MHTPAGIRARRRMRSKQALEVSPCSFRQWLRRVFRVRQGCHRRICFATTSADDNVSGFSCVHGCLIRSKGPLDRLRPIAPRTIAPRDKELFDGDGLLRGSACRSRHGIGGEYPHTASRQSRIPGAYQVPGGRRPHVAAISARRTRPHSESPK